MKKFVFSTFIGFGLGLAGGVYFMGYENLKSHIWGRYERHLARPSLNQVRDQKQLANYIQKFTAKIRAQSYSADSTPLVKSKKKPASKAVSSKPRKQSRRQVAKR
jgi:hypothetical protein